MKKKNITISEIEKKMKEMGAVEIPQEEFNSSIEYQNINNYVKKVFEKTKKNNYARKTKSPKIKI